MAPWCGSSRTRILIAGFVVHHLCLTTEQTILRLFDSHATPCRIVAELWSFENIKSFVQEDVGLAIVPRITVQRELRDGLLSEIPLQELKVQRRTLMIYRDQGYLSDSAQEMIRVVRHFNFIGAPEGREADTVPSLAATVGGLRDR